MEFRIRDMVERGAGDAQKVRTDLHDPRAVETH